MTEKDPRIGQMIAGRRGSNNTAFIDEWMWALIGVSEKGGLFLKMVDENEKGVFISIFLPNAKNKIGQELMKAHDMKNPQTKNGAEE